MLGTDVSQEATFMGKIFQSDNRKYPGKIIDK